MSQNATQRSQTNVAIWAGDLGVCLPLNCPEAGQAEAGGGPSRSHPFPLPTRSRGQVPGGSVARSGQEWGAGSGPSVAQRRAPVPHPVHSGRATGHRCPRLGRGALQGPLSPPYSRGSSIRLLGGGGRQTKPPSPALPTPEEPHPGQGLLLLGAQVADSAAHGA